MKITGQQAIEAIRKQKRCIYRRLMCSRRCEICDLDVDYELTAEAYDLAIESIHRDTIRKWAEDNGGRYMTIDEARKEAEAIRSDGQDWEYESGQYDNMTGAMNVTP